MAGEVFGLSERDIAKLKKLLRESGPVRSSKPGTRRTRREGGGGGGSSSASLTYGRVMKRVARPALIDDPNDTSVPPAQIPNPELWKDDLPEKVLKAKDAPAVSVGSPSPGPTFPVSDSTVDWPQVGHPVLFGEVSVVPYEKTPLPTPEEFLGYVPDPNVATDTFPDWWPPPWPDRYWEKMKLQTATDLDPTNPQVDKPHPHLITNPNWVGPADPDLSGENQFLPNDTKFITEYWSNPNLVPLATNMWVAAINKEIQTASPTTFQSSKLRTT